MITLLSLNNDHIVVEDNFQEIDGEFLSTSQYTRF